MKKGISLKLTVMTMVPLVVAVIDVAEASSWQASSSANRKCELCNNDKWNVIRARIKGSP
jgi:signal transduction histidine kinase